MIRDLHHTVLLVRDFGRSMDFYTDVLGAELVSRDDDRRGDFLDRMFNVPGVVIRLGLIRLGGEIIEIIEPVAPDAIRTFDGGEDRFGIARIGFEVDDIEGDVRRLRAAGVETLSEIVDMSVGHYAGGKVVFFRDPDGILLEFQQPGTPGQVT
ncbi:VOC family protein [Patulibacter sp.]|uniref:VOC family protein n=1 Tax=Patulibacter sp. TaxID=1912859 RepID=UPI0027263ED6|nr:VOC family protein [Patulibacter sp.]MDO9409006.1 VOC family protein [Patulibacter sp.]